MRIPFFSHWRQHRAMRDSALMALLHSNAQLHDEVKALRAQAGIRDPKRELLLIAAMNLADTFDDANLAHDVAPHLSELELAPVTELLHAAGYHEAAQFWERFNKEGDDSEPEPEDQDHAEPVSA